MPSKYNFIGVETKPGLCFHTQSWMQPLESYAMYGNPSLSGNSLWYLINWTWTEENHQTKAASQQNAADSNDI